MERAARYSQQPMPPATISGEALSASGSSEGSIDLRADLRPAKRVNSVTQSDLLRATRMKVVLAALMLALLAPPIPRATGETHNTAGKSVFRVTGQVRSFHADRAGNLEAGREVVVWLVPAKAGQTPLLDAELPHYRVTQHDKMFEPHLLVIPAGSIVEFVNHDPWFHNVFSVSRTRRFDLGFYKSGAQKTIRFDRAGVSYLFCQLHPEMVAVVLTVDSMYFGVSDKTGHISIGNVPPGKYVLHVWYENGTPQALEALRSAIFIGDDSRSFPAISIAASNRIQTTGRN
jgi:plastocyanin